MISNVSEVTYGGAVIGYTITFTSGKTITLYNGKDGAAGQNGTDGQDGYTPSIGVAQDTDGIYYWTVDSQWLTDANGNKIAVTSGKGDKGEKGDAGQDGTDGADGADGKTPQLKIEDGYWYLSYDGTNWTKLGKATGEDGKDGTNGTNGTDGAKGDKGDPGEKGDKGDNIFTSVTQDADYVYFTLADGTVIKIVKKGNSSEGDHADSDIIEFKDLNVKSALLLHSPTIDLNGDGEISYGEAKAAKRISITRNEKIVSFKELQYFTNITSVDFYGCYNLFEVTLPENLDSIPDNAFNGNHSVYTDNFSSSYRTYYNSVLCSIEIPKGVKYIGIQAFYNCSKLKQVTFAENSQCKTIGNEAFYGCPLESLMLPNSIEYIGSNFASAHLSKLSVPKNFLGDISADFGIADTIIWNPEYFSSDYTYSISSNTYYGIGCYRIPNGGDGNKTTKAVLFDENVIIIPAYLCYNCKSIKEIVIPDKVTTIGQKAFYGCNSITTVTIGASVAEIGYYAFNNTVKSMYIKATTPPNIVSNSIGSSTIIYVPKESLADYRTAWSSYATNIKGYDFE